MRNKPFNLQSELFQPKTIVNKRFVEQFVSAPKTNVSKQTFSQKQTNKLVEKTFVFGGLKLVATEFVLSFQFQTKVSKKGWFRTLKLALSREKR